MITYSGKRKGFSLVELTVATAVTALIMISLAFMTFFTARNFVVLHEQVMSQTQSAAGAERMVSIMRNAAYFEPFSEDTATTNVLHRIKVALPSGPGTVSQTLIAYNGKKRALQIFENGASVTFDSDKDPLGTPTLDFTDIEHCDFVMESQFRVSIVLAYVYTGFSRILQRPGNPQLGEFRTDVIAKNHFLDQGVTNYALDLGTSGPATL